MFQYEIDNSWKYWIWSDKISGRFWPFAWIYIKNSIHWDFQNEFDFSIYPWHKYSIWKTEKSYFVIWINWLKDILKHK